MATTPPYDLTTTHAVGGPDFVPSFNEVAGAVNDAGLRLQMERWELTTGFLNGWASALTRLVRAGNSCTLMLNGLNGAAATGSDLITLPVGFRASGLGSVSIFGASTGSSTYVPEGAFYMNPHTGTVSCTSRHSNIRASITWTTTDPWPVTDPGTPL